jgi:hypothetical protein
MAAQHPVPKETTIYLGDAKLFSDLAALVFHRPYAQHCAR